MVRRRCPSLQPIACAGSGRRWIVALTAACAWLLVLGLARAEVGALTPAGCIEQTGGTACPTVPGIDAAKTVVVSPDGANVYVAAIGSHAIATFVRGPGGTLTPGGCIQWPGLTECAGIGGNAPGLSSAFGAAVSPDGANVYVASEGSDAIAVFSRLGGALTPGGCIAETGISECLGLGGNAPGLDGANGVAVSPDGANVYVVADSSDTITAFARGTGGSLTPQGCIQNTGGTDCLGLGGTAPGLDAPERVAISRDGASVYVASEFSDSIAIFARGPGGALVSQGCIQNTGGTDCNGVGGTAPGLDGALDVAVSPDGANVYVVGYGSDAIAVFARAPNGALTPQGCIENTGGTTCATTAPGLGGPQGVTVSPDGANVYVASSISDTIVVFARGPGGALTAQGCIQNTGGGECAVTAPGLEGAKSVAVSPDGANVYVASSFQHSAIAIFARELPLPTTTTTTTTTTTLPGCPPDGFPGIRCALAPGLGQGACAAESLSRKIERRFERALRVLDQAEAAARPARAKRLLGRLDRLLGRVAGAVERAAARGKLAAGCELTLESMLGDARERVGRMAG